MATREKASGVVANCHPLVRGLAKNLVDRLYGPAGPAWGTAFAAVEQQALRLAEDFRKAFLDLALTRQATAFLDNPPAPLCLCPHCNQPTAAKGSEPRILFTRAATVEWLEPHRHCSKCRKAFFPQSKSLGLDLGSYSTSVLDLVCYAGANKASFREASTDLAKLSNLSVHEKQVERLCHRIGTERCDERDEQVRRYQALPLAKRCACPEGVTPLDSTQVAVIMADAGMLQLRDDPVDPASADPTPAGLVEPPEPDDSAQEDPDQQRPPSGRHWHEDKVGLVMRMHSKESSTDPCATIPDTFLDAEQVATIVRGLKKSAALQAEDAQQTPPDEQADNPPLEEARYEGPKLVSRQVVASRQSWPLFGTLLACTAYLAGFATATRKAFVADGAKAIWGVWQARFSRYEPILDFIHAMSYVYEAAKAVGQESGMGWKLYAEWITWTWQGKVSLVIERLTAWQQANGEAQADDASGSARRVVARTLGYLRNNQERMKYDEYRKKGLPIVSSLVESMVKQISRRVKGTEKFWSEKGAEAILQLRADYLSDGEVMAYFWQRRQEAATGQRSYRTHS